MNEFSQGGILMKDGGNDHLSRLPVNVGVRLIEGTIVPYDKDSTN